MAKFSLTIIDQNQVHRRLLQTGERLRVCRRESTEKAERSTQTETNLQLFQSSSRSVSTSHAEFRVETDGRVLVTDRGSTNGTWMRLSPGHEYTLPADGEVLLGTETTIKRKVAPWESFPEPNQFSAVKEFVTHLRSQFRDYISDLKILRAGSPELSRLEGTWSKYPLSGEQGYLAVNWKHTTMVMPIERWLRDSVLLFNCEQASPAPESAEAPWSFLAESESRRRVLALAKRIAKKTCPLLLIGPTGTGKEVLAHDIHAHGLRPDKPFVAVNCAALPENLMESMLFGVKAGAFTGAVDSQGLLETANGGTFFFDEIGEMPLPLQAKLLRVLEDYRIRRVGDTKEREVKVRIIAATLRNLEEMVAKGQFREDLYFRLNALQLDLPPLEPPDIAVISGEMLKKQIAAEAVEVPESEIEEICTLAAKSHWPGNARELRNAIWRYLALRDETRSATENWTSTTLRTPASEPDLRSPSTCSSPPVTRQEDPDLLAPEEPCDGGLLSGDGGVPLPDQLLECITCIDNLLFLHLAKGVLSQRHRGALRVIGDRAGMTSPGASAKLRRLKVVNASNEPDLVLIEAAIASERLRLARFQPYLRPILSM